MSFFTKVLRTRIAVSLLGIAFFQPLFAQQTPADCKVGCTSNDVQIKTAYLVDPITKVKLGNTFPCTGTANVKLTLELTTNTPRIGVTVFANIRTFVNGQVGSVITTVKECFTATLSASTKVTFNQAFGWPCNTRIVLTDVFLAWGTGNTDFCQGLANFRCPATPSKCYQLPEGQYIPIEVPIGQNSSLTQCSTSPGGTTSSFNLTSLNGTVSSNASNVTVSWYTDQALTQSISTPGAYSTASRTVYAKIANNTDPTVFGSATVTLTVIQRPQLSITNPTSVCSGTVDITALAVTSGSTLPSGTTLSYWTDANATVSLNNPTTAGNGTYYIKASTNTTPVCSDIAAVTVTVNGQPSAPTICVTQPSLCGSATGSITVTAPTGAGYSYSINGGQSWSTNPVFSGLAAGSNPSVVVKNSAGCISSATSCDDNAICTTTTNRVTSEARRIEPVTEAVETDRLQVRAYPNPFRNTVRFQVAAPQGGRAILEVFDNVGRRVATRDYGIIDARGRRTLDLNLGRTQNTMLLYRLRVGSQSVQGKLLQNE